MDPRNQPIVSHCPISTSCCLCCFHTWSLQQIPNTNELFKPLETSIRQRFLPALTGQNQFDDKIRDLLATPVRFGGLGITNPSHQSTIHHTTSLNITSPLTKLILDQSTTYPSEARISQVKARTRAHNFHRQLQSKHAQELKSILPSDLEIIVTASTEKVHQAGSRPYPSMSMVLLCTRVLSVMPSAYVMVGALQIYHPYVSVELNSPYSILSIAPRGGFPSIRHNEIRDITADLLSEVCHNVGTEPCLQPVTGEHLFYKTANREDRARLDVVAESFWGRDRQRAFFDVRIFNPFAQSLHNLQPSLSQCYRQNKLQKKRAYDQRVREIEHGSSALVFSTTGGMGSTATTVYKRIASLIASKHNKTYSKTIHWLRCRLSFSLLRSAIMCLCGSRSSLHHPETHLHNIDLALRESRFTHF